MCDTFAIFSDGNLFFGKNSDREPDEAQLVVRIPPVAGDRDEKVTTTYIEIDQAPDRHGVILSKPFWIWGAEMGANDRGVVIGNEAVFTRAIDRTPGLIGMDLLRLGLERGDTAEHALNVITKLLEQHGQGGVCGYRDKSFRYDNSFIIADHSQVWVLETAGRHWVAKRAPSHAAISNCLTIDNDYDLKSDGLEDFARKHKRLPKGSDFSFKAAFDTRLIPFFGAARKRLETSCGRLEKLAERKRIGLSDLTDILRSHQNTSGNPARGSNGDICMHAAGPVIRRNQTCGSMVSRINHHGALHLATGTSAPCLSIFKPVDPGSDHDFYVLNSGKQNVEESLWHRFESVHRRLLFSGERRREIRESRDAVEKQIFDHVESFPGTPPADRLEDADRIAAKWSEECIDFFRDEAPLRRFTPYGLYWRRVHERSGIL